MGEVKNAKSIENLLYSETITDVGETVYFHVIDVQYEGRDVLNDIYDSNNDNGINPKIIEGLPGKTIFDAHQVISFFIDEYFALEDNIADLKKFFSYFLNKVKVIQIETPNIGNALKIFETINDRGVSLDQVDLLKNLLLSV